MIYCCKEHIDIALDTIVDEYEVAPKMEEIERKEELPTTCEYCQNLATYVVGN